MFHLHHLIFFPFFLLFHVVGIVFLFVGAAVVFKALRYRRFRLCQATNPDRSAGARNQAFEDYRQTTLRKLEAEADEFRKYLASLRRAADAAAFEAFLKSRRADAGPAQ